jgi:hypothetical protein
MNYSQAKQAQRKVVKDIVRRYFIAEILCYPYGIPLIEVKKELYHGYKDTFLHSNYCYQTETYSYEVWGIDNYVYAK